MRTRTLLTLLHLCTVWALVGPAVAKPVELSNQHMTIRLDPDDGYAISGIVNRAHEIDFIEPRPEGVEQDRSPWLLWVRGPQVSHQLTAADAAEATHSLDGDTLTVTWRGIAGDVVPGDLTVTATIRLPDGSRRAYLHAEVSGSVQGYLWQLDFPRVFGVRDFPDCQMALPYYWGRLVRKPMQLGRAASLVYPEPASMQWFAYWGAGDDRDPPFAEAAGRNPESGWSPAEPVEVAYSMPYEAVIAVFTGDWHEAGQIYLDWAEGQVWAQRGTVDDWRADTPAPGSDRLARWTPPWFRDIGFWAKFYHEPAKILPEWAAYRRWLGVPVASHWYRYNIASFNDNDPEHLPPDPYVLDGVRAARELGVEPMPYVLATIWDTDTQSWINEDGLRGAIKNEAGDIVPWVIGNDVFAWMCPHTEQWRAKMREICEKLIWEHGMSGVYLDVLAAGAARPCYDPSHGHPVHGGNYYGQGARTLMFDLRADIRRLDPDAAFFTEEIGEHLIDVMDGYLTLDLTRSYTPGGEQVWPILTAVYHPYTINFGSDAGIGMEPDQFAVLYGRQLVWGSQPLHSVLVPPMPEEGDPTAEMFRDYTRAYWVAGEPFLMGGRMLRLAVRPEGAPEGRCGLEMAAGAHTVEYDLRKDRLKIWTGPAVLASAWERFGDIGVVMANITGQERSVELTVRGEVMGIGDAAQMVGLWPGEPEVLGAAAGEHSLTLAPYRTAVYCLTDDPEAAIGRLNELEETPWEFEVVTDGPLPSVNGPEGSLFACSDGPVLNEPGDRGTVATAHFFDQQGALKPRFGRQAEVTGGAAEGHGLPRELDERPFALLRRLPHTATVAEPGIMVLSGDEHHLLAVAPGGAEITFDGRGLLVACNAVTAEIVRPLSERPARSLTLPAGEAFVVGWARFDADEVAGLLSFGDRGIIERVRPLADRLVGLANAPRDRRAAELAAASRQFVAIATSFGDLPGALSPVSPLTTLHERLNALVVAQLDTRVAITADHRWLAPALDKRLAVVVQGARPEDIAVTPVGFWRDGACRVAELGMPSRGSDTLIFSPTVRLDDGLYVERVIPMVASATVTRDGAQYAVADILRLEANRPYQLVYSKTALTAVAGRPRTTTIRVRNWSPLDLTLALGGSGPEGWQVTPAQATVEAPALSDIAFDVAITPPADARRGSYDVRVVSNHADREDTGFIAVLPVNLLDALVPLTPDVAEWQRPELEERSRIRQSSKFAVYAAEGEEIAISISNIRVTHYEDTLTWRLLGPSMELVDEGSIPVDEAAEVSHIAEAAGTWYLEVVPKQGSADVAFENRAVAEVATEQDPLQLFCSHIERHFYVPAGSAGFRLGARDGGPTETARFVITSPTGRVAFEADGNYNGAQLDVQVQPDEAGKAWSIRVDPEQDIAFWLAGDVLPYLSTAPERMLIRSGD